MAAMLGIDYAKAVVGFEHHSKKAHPTIDGIVVDAAHEELVLSGMRQVSEAKASDRRRKRQAEVLLRWKRIVQKACIRQRLREEDPP